ncbi:vacuole protein [Coprinellus micaceus]|uniref:Vacuole protein n=1 Tax=Coprinellus micaceus TaxID=71717 RepID=A0A4Y7T985_COPMI|nr:vacuole protein [Coprinellus micaceus]
MCGGSKWKREEVPDHKFDFIDTREFYDNSFFMRVKYIWVYVIVLKSFLVYISDIFSAITMLTSKTWSNQIFQECGANTKTCFFIPFDVGKWLFVSCIIFSFLLLAYESQKSKKIIASRDISFAFTNVMANNYYTLRSYNHFCFFEHISDSTKTIDDFAFFVFFTFKSWKRLLLADGPRQTINAVTLYAVWVLRKDRDGGWWEISKYFAGNKMSTTLLTITALFTVLVFAGSLLLLIVAAICYIPLIFHIRGNLKEYCCHKVDKRIGDVMKRRRKERLAENAKFAQKEAMGDYSHLKNKKGEVVGKPLPQPTLPNISLDDDDDTSTIATSRAGGSSKKFYEGDNNSLADYPPPMPAYNPYSTHQGAYGPQYNMSTTSISNTYDDPTYGQPYHDEDSPRGSSTAAGYSSNDYYSQNSAGTGISRHGTPFAGGNAAYDDARQQGYVPSTTPQPVDDRYYHPSSTPQPGGRYGGADNNTGYAR